MVYINNQLIILQQPVALILQYAQYFAILLQSVSSAVITDTLQINAVICKVEHYVVNLSSMFYKDIYEVCVINTMSMAQT